MGSKRRQEPKISLADLRPDEALNVEIHSVQSTPAAKKLKAKAEEYMVVSPEIASLLDEETAEDAGSLFDTTKMLSDSEKAMYAARRKQYYNEFNLNKSSDVGLIHRVIMEEILAERLYEKFLDHPDDKDLSDHLTASHKRYQTALEALGASRDKRIKNKESAGLSIADVAKEYFSSGKKDVASKKEKWDQEEKLLEEQQNHLLGLQFGSMQDDSFVDDE